MATSGTIFLNQLEKECLKHRALKHPLLERLSYTRPDISTIKVFAEQFYYYSRNFSRYLASAVWACPDEYARSLFIKVLFEEYGGSIEKERGIDPDLSHPAMLRMFLKAAGVETTPAKLKKIEPLPETKLFVKKYSNLQNMDYIKVLGALGIGTLNVVLPLHIPIYHGCLNYGFSGNDLLFFDEHIDLDKEHYEDIKNTLVHFADIFENQEMIRKGTLEFLDARNVFFNGIEKASFIKRATFLFANTDNNTKNKKSSNKKITKVKRKK